MVTAPVEYVIVHELFHLKVKNRSQDFWRLVAEVLTDVGRRKCHFRQRQLAVNPSTGAAYRRRLHWAKDRRQIQGFHGASSGMLSAAYAVSAACPHAADNCDQTYYTAWGPLMMRMTRHGAAARLAVSEATIDRMIKRGDLATEREPQGTRYKVWVLVDDDADTPVETGDQAEMHYAEKTVETSGIPVYTNGNDMTALRTEVGSLRELAEYRKKLLEDSEWRYQELLQQLKLSQENMAALTRALPPPATSAPMQPRRWWPFGKR